MDTVVKFKSEYVEKIKNINNNRKLKYYILTMGCQLNENDSEKLCGMLENMNYTRTTNMEDANIILFNTCCVRENAEEKLFGKLGEAKKYKEENNAIIAIGGCMMQQNHIVEKIKKSYPYTDIIFGTHTIYKFPEDLWQALGEKKIVDIVEKSDNIVEEIPISREDKIKASVTIMNGCNNFCTYCIVPYVRGREISRNPKDIIREIECLAQKGYKEIMLLGQNVNSYLVSQKQKGENVNYDVVIKDKLFTINSFATLLEAINQIDGIEKIRFISPHPKDFTDDVIEAIKNCEKVSKAIHLPMQSGNSEILKKMNRKYTKEQYLDLVNKIRRSIPDVTFSTDIIVGFPGETEENFKDTLDVVNKVKFEQVFMFIYSKRVGTPAEKMEEQVPEEEKHRRFEELKKLVESQIKENNSKYIGTIQKILVEGTSKNNDNMLTGRTDSNKVVNFKSDDIKLIGNMIDLKIISEHMWYLKGEYEEG